MKLILTSTGLPNEIIRKKFLELVGKEAKDITVGFVPTAADPYDDKWFLDASINEINNMGMKLKIIDLKGESEQSLKKKLEDCDVIYVNGGNTFYLLDWVRKSGFDKVIKPLLNQGKVYIGTSAGSILVGPDISISGWDPSWDTNDVGLVDCSGLNCVPFVTSPHFTEAEREVLERKMKNVNYPVIAITDKQAIIVDGDKQELIGEGEEIVLKTHKRN